MGAWLVLPPLPALAQPTQGGALYLEKTQFAPGEEIRVSFRASADYAGSAWVGIIPSSVPHGSEAVNDQHDITYQYLEKRTSGVLVFRAPAHSGAYDFRMHDRDDNGKEVASVSFRVSEGSPAAPEPPTATPKPQTAAAGAVGLRLEGTTFAPGADVRVAFWAPPGFQANAWIGIIPSDVPHGSEGVNDQHDLTYQYLNNRAAGELVFKAPDQPGAYDFRMHDRDDNGAEVASVSFRVQ
jgi:hypothetical protein